MQKWWDPRGLYQIPGRCRVRRTKEIYRTWGSWYLKSQYVRSRGRKITWTQVFKTSLDNIVKPISSKWNQANYGFIAYHISFPESDPKKGLNWSGKGWWRPGVVVYTCCLCTCKSRAAQKFKVTLPYKASLKPVWAIRPCLNTKRKCWNLAYDALPAESHY